ncbi:UNVERIFIED_CONTAM: O-fucosyltransferase 15 [Sesamum radiatum]|uniref:O-fucosyltransferase 15 n=1 Tax=Sesamum radiatum TaxID=300843 RepID=A0AAW2KGW6_SESRA
MVVGLAVFAGVFVLDEFVDAFSDPRSGGARGYIKGESKPSPKDLWVEPYISASSWTPCANARDWEPSEGKSGYIMVTANGGINQQRVAFGDIFQEDHFINYLKPDIPIVKELPKELQSLDLEAIGSMVRFIPTALDA